PNWNIAFATDCLNLFGLRVPADAAELEIDDLSGAKRDRVFRILARMNRLIQTNRRRDLLLQLSMIEDIVMSQRLLDHHQVKLIQLLEERDVGERVGRVRVSHQFNVWKLVAYLRDDFQIPTW